MTRRPFVRPSCALESRRAFFTGRRPPAEGFALLFTLAVVALLLLLLLTLATLVRVETRLSAETHKQDAARQRALFALQIALGQLQAQLGPDSRLSAQANLLDAHAPNPWFTGVWSSDAAGAPVLRTWLVSGNETDPLKIIPQDTSFDGITLLGPASVGPAGDAAEPRTVTAPLIAIHSHFAEAKPHPLIGRYAWWVGDQGVKASLALPDRSSEVNYAPWYAPAAGNDQRRRIRQQIATAPAFFHNALPAENSFGFDPLDPRNAARISRVLTPAQLDLLSPATGADSHSLTLFRQTYFHALTDCSYATLSNTLPIADAHRGLQADLSQSPALLGDAFIALTRLSAYMETPSETNTAVPPIRTLNSPRRRYAMRAPVVSPATADFPEIVFKVAPVLSSFMLQFRVLKEGERVVLKARMLVELWNPYTAALVPETLSLHIGGLPRIRVSGGGAEGGGDAVEIALQSAPAFLRPADADDSGGTVPARTLAVNLPFVANGDADRASWLPGRYYAWRTAVGGPGGGSADLAFYDKNVGAYWNYADVLAPATGPRLRVDMEDAATLTFALKDHSGRTLAAYTSPAFPPFSIPDVEADASAGNWVFGFGFRLRQPSTFNRERTWLKDAPEHLLGSAPGPGIFDAFNESLGLDPDAYRGSLQSTTGLENFLLIRAMGVSLNTTRSAYLDVPIAELPRLPHLSVGELQHLVLPGRAPFAIGNPWGAEANACFDRFFFSGLTDEVSPQPDLAAGAVLPNWNLRFLGSRPQAPGAPLAARLLQAGGFNVHATQPEAWRAVLTGMRFSADAPFVRAAIDNTSPPVPETGSQALAAPAADETFPDHTLDERDAQLGGPAFFRFPQSAQETYAWEKTPGKLSKFASTQAFRQGIRGGSRPAAGGSTLHTLTSDQVAALADAIVARLREHGPFESLQAFLAPNPAWSGNNLLTQAIADAGINPPDIAPSPIVNEVGAPGFSSLTLTSADILTALAPWLRTRSDTFLVRAYGEAVNPFSGRAEGRAWCEALVQRFPDLVDPLDPDIAAPAPGGFGRRFRILRFRWLSPFDL